MARRELRKWPEKINKERFIKEAQTMGSEEQAELYGVSPRQIRTYRSYLKDNGIRTRSCEDVAKGRKQIPDSRRNEFINDTFTMTNSQLVTKYRVSRSTILKYKDAFTAEGYVVGRCQFPKPLGRSFNDQLRLDIPRFICMGDSEIPDHDPEWFELVVAVAETWGIKDLIINGDFVALDSLSSWMKQLARHQTFEDELQAAKEALTAFSQTFDNIYYLQANHERRLAHAIEGQMSFGSQLKDQFGVTVSEYPYCWVTSNGEEYLICHPDNYSRIPLSVPLALSNINHKHLIVGHTHRLAEGRSKSGSYRIIEGGHMRDLEKTAYKTLRINTHPAWNPGFVLVIDGLPWILDKEKALFFIDGFQKALGGK